MAVYVTEVRENKQPPVSGFPGTRSACLLAESEAELEATARLLQLPLAWQDRTADSHQLPYYHLTEEQRGASLVVGVQPHALCRGLILGCAQKWFANQWERQRLAAAAPKRARESKPARQQRPPAPRSKLIPDDIRALFVKE